MQEHIIPIIELWGHLVVPLQGDISDTQMEQLQDRVLHRVRDRATDGLVIDTSGVQLMDSHLCAVLGELAAAARLMGARPVLCGLNPAVVMTLQTMGIDLGGIDAALSLEAALEHLGVRVLRSEEPLDLGLAGDGDADGATLPELNPYEPEVLASARLEESQ